MCRWLATRQPVPLEELLYKPADSLIEQSLHSRLGAETTNGDGFGVGWYGNAAGPGSSAASSRPGTTGTCARSPRICVPLVFAHVRASTGTPMQQTNCHPFRHDNWLCMHNGLIRDFPTVKRDLVLAVDPTLFRHRGHDRLGAPLPPGADVRSRGRPPAAVERAGRTHRGCGQAARGRAPDPDDGRDHERRADLGVPLFQRRRARDRSSTAPASSRRGDLSGGPAFRGLSRR